MNLKKSAEQFLVRFGGILTAVTEISKRALLLALLPMMGCVSTPQGTTFDPIEGGRRFNEKLDATLERLGDRSYHDTF